MHSQLFVKPQLPTAACHGQTIIVTGSNTGLGKEAARHFAQLGASRLILAVRNIEAGEAAKKDIEATTGCEPGIIQVWHLDLSNYNSIESFVEEASKLSRVDVLLNNAGVLTFDWNIVQSHECTIAINVISTFYLSLAMLPKLKATARETGSQPRITIVTSDAHIISRFTELTEPNIFAAFDNEARSTAAIKMDRYPTSKLIEILVVRQIATLLDGSGVIFNMVNPGMCKSELGREAGIFNSALAFFFARNAEIGAMTLVGAALAGPESIGRYFSDGRMNDGALSKFVRSPAGEAVGVRVWDELRVILEIVQRGVTGNLSPGMAN